MEDLEKRFNKFVGVSLAVLVGRKGYNGAKMRLLEFFDQENKDFAQRIVEKLPDHNISDGDNELYAKGFNDCLNKVTSIINDDE